MKIRHDKCFKNSEISSQSSRNFYNSTSTVFAPSDFWLFDFNKKNIDDHTDVKSQATKILQSIPKEEYLKTFESG